MLRNSEYVFKNVEKERKYMLPMLRNGISVYEWCTDMYELYSGKKGRMSM